MKNETNEQTIKRLRKENLKEYPVILKNKEGGLVIIYRNRREFYKKQSQDRITDLETGEFIPYDELNMCLDNGFKRVKDTTDKDDWRFENE